MTTKTLKDLKEDRYGNTASVDREELKTLAIKHLQASKNQNIRAFIIKFFNILEDDLK